MKSVRQFLSYASAVVAIAFLLAAPSSLVAQAPAGATFKCSDGTYSTAKTKRGACSQHGGVAQELGAAAAAEPAATPTKTATAKKAAGGAPAGATFKCTDGTYS